MSTHKVNIVETADGTYLELSDAILAEAGWETGDTVEWSKTELGTWSITKKQDTEWVLVECVSTFRQRYMVEVPAGKQEWALDTVSSDDAICFSSEHLGEHIVSHRVVSKQQALDLCDIDNDYGQEWNDELKVNNFFTKWQA